MQGTAFLSYGKSRERSFAKTPVVVKRKCRMLDFFVKNKYNKT